MKRYKRKGRVDITDLNTPPEKHELATAKFFARLEKDIVFIKPSNRQDEHSPDFWMDGLAWEVKSPKGKSPECLYDNIRDAVKQSYNIIIDLRRIKIPDEKCLTRIKFETKVQRKIKNLLVITRSNQLLTIKSTNYKI